jgi:hypothetical protein
MVLFSSRQLIDDVGDYLQVNTDLGSVTTDIFVGFMPSTPVTCTAVYAQPGVSIPGDPIVRPGVQVTIRDSTYLASHTMAETAFNALQSKWNVSSTVKGRLVPNHEVGANYRDGNQNILFTLNFSFTGVRGTE